MLLELCDRILVLCGGMVSGIVDARNVDKREVGLMMTSLSRRSDATPEYTKPAEDDRQITFEQLLTEEVLTEKGGEQNE